MVPTASYRKKPITSPWALPLRVRALTGHPPHQAPRTYTRTNRGPEDEGWGLTVSVLTPALNTAHFATALRHFGFPRTAGAFWERRATPVPNGSSPGPRGGGDCAVSAEEHLGSRRQPKLNKEGLFNVAVGLRPSAAGANTIVSAALLTVACFLRFLL